MKKTQQTDYEREWESIILNDKKKLFKETNMHLTSKTYSNDTFQITESMEIKDHISIHSYGEPCSGVLRHWGSKKQLIKELEEMIKAIKELNGTN